MASRFASVTVEHILSINEAAVSKTTKLEPKFDLTDTMNGKLFNLSKLKFLCARKSIAQ